MQTDDKFQALVVDDETSVRELTIRSLQREGIRCDSAVDGIDADRKLAEITYDLIVTDLKMPNKNGHALAVEVLQKPDRPIMIVLTGILEPKLAKDLYARGLDAIEFKPVDYKMFAAKTVAMLNQRRASRESSEESLGVEADLAAAWNEDVSEGDGSGCVEHAMTRKVESVPPTTSMKDVARVMNSKRVRHLAVANSKNELVGVITQRDVFRQMGQLYNIDEEVARANVAKYMCSDVATVLASDSIKNAARQMLAKRIGCLPVTDENKKLIGILTRSDLLKQLA